MQRRFRGLSPGERTRDARRETGERTRDERPETEWEGSDDSYEDVADEPVDEAPLAGEPAAAAIPPLPKELALCEFLMANEYDKTLDGMVGEFLPPVVFAHDFTRRFVETWRAECTEGQDLFATFAEALPPEERTWFDTVLLNGGKSQASGLSATDILEDFVRSLWAERLKRERGALPAAGDAEADLRRMKISMDLKRLQSVRWHSVKEMVREFARATLP